MRTRTRRAAGFVAVAMLIAVLLGAPQRLRPFDAFAALEGGEGASAPTALATPLWSGAPTASAADVAAADPALRIIRHDQLSGVLRGVLGPRPARVVQAGTLESGGRPVGASVLLSLPVARHNVHATVPIAAAAPGGGVRVGHAGFMAPVLRDVLVDVDLHSGKVIGVEPGPASRTSAWSAAPSTPAPIPVVAAPSTPPLVRLSSGGPGFAAYDGNPALGTAGRDWPVSLVFTGHATIAKVKQALRSVGFTHTGEQRWLGYGAAGGSVRFDGDRGLKTAQDANGTDVHVRLYAPPSGHLTDPRLGDVVIATAHLDRGEGAATPPRVYGFSEVAEQRIADVLARRLGWHVQRDSVALGNAQSFRRDLAAPDHIWWSNGRATLVRVP